VGGGLRTLKEVEELLKLGVDRVVLGSVVVTDPQMTATCLETFGPEKITFALDVQIQNGEPIVMTHGWTKSSQLTFKNLVDQFAPWNLKRVLCTDIAVDGRMVGPNLDLYRRLLEEFPQLEIQASGGVEKLSDLKDLSATGVHSVVVGRALLSGKFTLSEALSYAQ
jgi:phosphoribosylformimino-5-aminoimidazole carboxamide ribotide isomerase